MFLGQIVDCRYHQLEWPTQISGSDHHQGLSPVPLSLCLVEVVIATGKQ